MERATAAARAHLLAVIRGFFAQAEYLEVDTPCLASRLIPEAHIPVFDVTHSHPWEPEERYYLIPSPEVHMKRLLANGYGNIYRLGPSFRNAESKSPIHEPEFTMLEWYTVEADYLQSVETTKALLLAIRDAFWPRDREPPTSTLSPPWLEEEPKIISVEEALLQHAGAAPRVFDRHDGMRETAKGVGMAVQNDESEEDLFHRLLINQVEPALPRDGAVILIDYPSWVPTLAQSRPDRPRVSERWELYVCGIELANCYTEERDRSRLRAYLDSQQAACAKADGPFGPVAESLVAFSAAPQCSGVALGFDRLLMTMLGVDDIRGVIFER